MIYYLETSALRKLSKKLNLLENSFTSSLALVELLSGINSLKEFELRRSIIIKVMLSNIEIDWEFPESIKASAFPSISGTENRINDLKKIIENITNIEDYSIFLRESNLLNYNLNYFKKYDQEISKSFVHFGKEGIRESINLTKEQLKQKYILQELNKSLFQLNYSCTIMSIAKMYAIEMGKKNDELLENELFSSYSGNIDFYIAAYSYYSAHQLSKSQFSGKNDAFDLLHFLYLRNNQKIKLVSSDKLIQKIADKIYPQNYANPDDIMV